MSGLRDAIVVPLVLAASMAGCTGSTPASPTPGAPVPFPPVALAPYVRAISRVVIRQGGVNGPVVIPAADGSHALRVAGVFQRPAYVMEVWTDFAAVWDPERRTEGSVSANYPIGLTFTAVSVGAGGPSGERMHWSFSFEPPPTPGPGHTITVGYTETRPGTDFRHDVSKTVAIVAIP